MIKWTGEAELGLPYWWDSAASPLQVSDELPPATDILIIGAGYTGLSAAIAAHDSGAEVTVVDADFPGQGASTRNGGMFGAHPRLDWSQLASKFGVDTADGLFAEAKTANEYVKNLIEKENIACDYQMTGRIQLSWTKQHFVAQKNLATQVRAKSEVKVDIVERDELKSEINTERYFGAIVLPEHGGIDPRKFHDGLMTAVLSRDIRLLAHTPVEDLARQGSAFVAKTPKGSIKASKVILATNGYTPAIFRWHQRRVFPLPSFLIATEKLPHDLISQLAPGRRMMVETRARHSYFRVSPDGDRILFGGRSSMRPIGLARSAARLQATMVEIWPDLKDVKLSHAWWGNTGYSFSHMPSIGEQDGLFYAMGYSGSGTVMAPYLGSKIGKRAAGAPGNETAYANTHLRPSWLHPFPKPYFLHAADLWYQYCVDRIETYQGRSSHIG